MWSDDAILPLQSQQHNRKLLPQQKLFLNRLNQNNEKKENYINSKPISMEWLTIEHWFQNTNRFFFISPNLQSFFPQHKYSKQTQKLVTLVLRRKEAEKPSNSHMHSTLLGTTRIHSIPFLSASLPLCLFLFRLILFTF